MAPLLSLVLLIPLALVACAPPAATILRQPFDNSAHRSFLTPAPLLPFRATGSVRLTYGGQKESGEFIVLASRRQAFQFQLLSPVTGSLVLELRFDSDGLLALNHTRDTYFYGPNNAENRRRLFALDMTPAEFLMAMTGRVPASAFAAANGEWLSPRRARMGNDTLRYEFTLDRYGLPSWWVKERNDAVVFRVEYRDYLQLPTGGGPPLRLPRKMRIYSAAGTPLLILGVRKFEPGARSATPISAEPPGEEPWRFEPLPVSAN